MRRSFPSTFLVHSSSRHYAVLLNLVRRLARPQALGRPGQALRGPSRAGPNPRLERAQGLGLKELKPEPARQARASVVDTFIFEIAFDEKDYQKRDNLTALRLTEAEWGRIDLLLNVLQSAQDAQHAFSADLRSTLHLAIPALDKLHAEWTAKSTNEKYSVFHDALTEVLLKVDEYYHKTSSTNSYMLAIVQKAVPEDARRHYRQFNDHSHPKFKGHKTQPQASSRAQAQAPRPEALPQGLGLGLGNLKPKPAEAGPKPGLPGRAGP
ncbi:hypothetical protein B0H19DRAFT_1083923 [Mycena capillaripes]|nr:hypothetical protein B0H19DRAFT_1083923 [Mycena capillaripes]